MKSRYVLGLVVLFFSCKSHSDTVLVNNTVTGGALGTSYGITFITHKKMDFQQEIDSVFEAINTSMSTYIPNSDISKINMGDSTVVVDTMFKEVFLLSSKVHSASKGYFDPTVGVLANAWGFGPEHQITLDSSKVDSLMDYVGWKKVALLPNGTIKKENPNIRFDFNAVAKGYAIDRLGTMLDQKGVNHYLVEVGGEVLTKGTNLIKQKPWTVGIDQPNNLAKRGTAAIITLENRALASSGNYRKFRYDQETGEKYVHTIDPLSGFTKNGKVLAASVLAKDCATADAYATTFMAMDLPDSIELLEEREDLEGFLIYLDSNDATVTYMTKGFKDVLVE